MFQPGVSLNKSQQKLVQRSGEMLRRAMRRVKATRLQSLQQQFHPRSPLLRCTGLRNKRERRKIRIHASFAAFNTITWRKQIQAFVEMQSIVRRMPRKPVEAELRNPLRETTPICLGKVRANIQTHRLEPLANGSELGSSIKEETQPTRSTALPREKDG